MIDTMSLHDLPPELITRIYDFLDPSFHLNFALTDKHLASYSSDLLGYHRKCHELYSQIKDNRQDVLQNLLVDVASNPIIAYHVRTLELWAERNVDNDLNLPALESYDDAFVAAANKIWLWRQLWGYPDQTHSISELRGRRPLKSRGRLELGKKDVLRVLLATRCPRLRCLKYRSFSAALPDEYADQRSGEDWVDSMIWYELLECTESILSSRSRMLTCA